MTLQANERNNALSTPWTMQEFFAGSGLVAYGLDGVFRPVWSNDICDKKATVYRANFSDEHFVLGDIKNISGASLPFAHLSWASFPCQDLSLAGSLRGIDAERSGLVHGASVADSHTERNGDFVINNTIIHCTTAPGEPLIQKCKANIRSGCLPIIITIFERVQTALDLAADAELSGRIDVWDIQQFLSTNINEHALFNGTTRNAKLADIIENYNAIIDEKESDPSLRIEFETKCPTH